MVLIRLGTSSFGPRYIPSLQYRPASSSSCKPLVFAPSSPWARLLHKSPPQRAFGRRRGEPTAARAASLLQRPREQPRSWLPFRCSPAHRSHPAACLLASHWLVGQDRTWRQRQVPTRPPEELRGEVFWGRREEQGAASDRRRGPEAEDRSISRRTRTAPVVGAERLWTVRCDWNETGVSFRIRDAERFRDIKNRERKNKDIQKKERVSEWKREKYKHERLEWQTFII